MSAMTAQAPVLEWGTARPAVLAARLRRVDEDLPCELDPALFLGPCGEEEDPADRAAREAAAIDLCRECPALAACREYAQRIEPTEGVWAAMTAEEIRALARRRTSRGKRTSSATTGVEGRRAA